jgi:hypothetical protein
MISLVIACTESPAVDQGVTGKKLLIKSGKLVLISKDPSIGVAGSDPVDGSDSSITFDQGGGVVPFSLPKTLWGASGSGAIFKYKNGAAPGGPSPVKVAKLKAGLLKVVAKGSPFAVPAGAATIAVVFSLDGGTNTYCMTFSGVGDGRKFLVKGAAAGTCAPPPTPTPVLGCCSGPGQVCAPDLTSADCSSPSVFVPGGTCVTSPGGVTACAVPGTPTATVPGPTPTATPALGCCAGLPGVCSATLTDGQCPFPGVFVPGGACVGGGGHSTCAAPGTATSTVPPATPTPTPVLGCCAGSPQQCSATLTSAQCPIPGGFIPGGICVAGPGGQSICAAPGTATPTVPAPTPTATPVLGCCSGGVLPCSVNVTIAQCFFPGVFVPGGQCVAGPGGAIACGAPGTPTPTASPTQPGASPTATTDSQSDGGLLFTEYVEGTANNQALEIGNRGAPAVELAVCEIRRYTNGSATASAVIHLSRSILQQGEVFVICHPAFSNLSLCDQTDSNLNHTGNDTYELHCGVTIDVFGQIGTDPGPSWTSTSGTYSTRNDTLRRLPSVTTGDPVGSDDFTTNLDNEWSGFGVDVFTGLGND